jgi:hypothetical protein
VIIFTITGPFATDGGRGAILAVGDPITFDWGIPEGVPIPPDVGNVRGHIKLDDQAGTIWDSSPIGAPWMESDALEARPSLYTRGLHALHLTIAGLRAGRPYVIGAKLALIYVSRPLLRPDVWTWDMPPLGPRGFAELSWRQPYQVSGTLTNVMPVATLTGSLTLMELNDVDHVTQVFPASVDLRPGGTTTLAFPPETQTWEWIIPVIYVVRPNQASKDFIYTVAGVLEDQFQNRYTLRQQLIAVVSLPPWKAQAGLAAFGGAIVSAIFLVLAAAAATNIFTAATVPQLMIAAAAAYSSASSAYALAIDPPSPDPWYRERVEIVTMVLPPLNDSDKVLEPYWRFIEIAKRIPATGTAISVVEGRILGADKAGDAASKVKQESRLDELHVQWTADAVEVVNAAAAVRDLGTLEIASDALVKLAAELRAQGASPDLRDLWTANDLPRETLDALEKLLQFVDPSSFSTLTQAIFDWSACLAQMAQAHEINAHPLDHCHHRSPQS